MAIGVFERADLAALECLRETEMVGRWIDHQINIAQGDVDALRRLAEQLKPYTIGALRADFVAAASKDRHHGTGDSG